MLRSLIAILIFTGCSREFQISRPPREGGFVEQLDGTPKDTGFDGLRPVDPDSPDYSTLGTRFALGFMESASPFDAPPARFEVWIESQVATRAEIVGQASGFRLQALVNPGITVVPLPKTQLEPVASGFVFPLGLELLTDDPVNAIAFHHREGFTESTRLLPITELGVTHRVMAVPDDLGESPSSFVVVATENDTNVTITPTVATADLRPPTAPFSTTLQAGELIQVQAEGDLSGTTVNADQRVAVFSGGVDPSIDCEGANHTWEQVPPLSRWATDWLVAPWPEQPYQYVLLQAAEPGTVVTLDCEPVATLALAGDTARVQLDQPGRIRANRPILVQQLSIGGSCGRDKDDTPFGDPNLWLAARTLLTRDRMFARPAEDPSFGAAPPTELRRDALITARTLGTKLDILPTPDAATLFKVEDLIVDTSNIDRLAVVEGEDLRGFMYGVTEYNAYAFDIGADCEGCAANLATPATCD
ncbi:MAG: IgGFc-binding protein [Myxococcota bacterium]